MAKITAVTIVPNTQHPAVGSKVVVKFDDETSIRVYQDTLLGRFDTDEEKKLIGKQWDIKSL